MKPVTRRLYAVAALALAAVIFVCVNIAADAWITTAKLDLTENGAFTLSPGTRGILEKISEPITLKFYYSKKIGVDYAQVAAYAGRVHDLLRQYASLSHGRIILQEIDPEPLTDDEDQAANAGLVGLPTDTGDAVYFGLVGTNRIDGKEVIAYFTNGRDIADREPRLESDLSTLIYHLSQPKKPVLGIVSSLPLDTGAGGMQAAMAGQSQPYAIYSVLSESYNTEMLDPGLNRIPDDVSVLMVVHPANLSAAALYAIDQFVLKGGHALIFVDPNSELAGAGAGMDPRGGGAPASDLPRLFQAWGVAYSPNRIIADRALAQSVRIQDGVTNYPIWLRLTPANFDPKDLVTAQMQLVNLASAGALFPVKGATTSFSPLMRSSDQAELMDAQIVRANQDPAALMAAIHPGGEQFTIAARVSGLVKTAFAAGPPAPMTTAGQPPPPPLPPQIRQSLQPMNVIVVADSDILDDKFWVQVDTSMGKRVLAPTANNGAFVIGAVDSLMGSNDLISLRMRSTSDRPFTVVKDMTEHAQATVQAEAQRLRTALLATQQRLHDLEQAGDAAQQAALDGARKDVAATRTQLREVEHRLRKDVDALGQWLAFLNIAAVPLLLVAFAIVQAWLRRRRRARALAAI